MCWERFSSLAALLAAFLLGWAGAAAAEQRRVVADFEIGLPPGAQAKSFAGHTDYRRVPEGDGWVLQADSRGAASGLVFPLEFEPAQWPVLRWRWKVERVLEKGDARTRAGDDYPARVYVIFPHWLFYKTRTLVYIWDNRLPVGTALPNAYTDNAMMLVVESGPERAGQWVEERRHLVEDYRRLFGEEPPRAGAIAVMTDTDNTGETARAWYDDLVLENR